MWKALWQKWTIDKPAMLGDWLWDVFVVQLAAFLDRLTLRQIVVFLPLLLVVLAYYHNIPVSPGLVLLGDLLAYIDIFSMLLLLSFLSRAATVLFFVRQATTRIARVASTMARRLDFRHRRERGAKTRTRLTGWLPKDEDAPAVAGGFAWA